MFIFLETQSAYNNQLIQKCQTPMFGTAITLIMYNFFLSPFFRLSQSSLSPHPQV